MSDKSIAERLQVKQGSAQRAGSSRCRLTISHRPSGPERKTARDRGKNPPGRYLLGRLCQENVTARHRS